MKNELDATEVQEKKEKKNTQQQLNQIKYRTFIYVVFM